MLLPEVVVLPFAFPDVSILHLSGSTELFWAFLHNRSQWREAATNQTTVFDIFLLRAAFEIRTMEIFFVPSGVHRGTRLDLRSIVYGESR